MDDLSDAKIRNAAPGDKLFSAAAKHRLKKSENRMARSAAACSRRCHSALIPSAAAGSMHTHCIAVSATRPPFRWLIRVDPIVPANLDKAFARAAAVQPLAGL